VQNIPSWQEVPLKEILEKKFQVPVYVNNDANCFALGECYYGQGKNFRHIVGLAIGTGLGAGIIIDGKLYNGSNCGAGEIGTIPWREQTVEYYCSGQYFQKVIGIPGKILHERAGRGDKEALAALASFGHEFGLAIMIAMYAYDPEIIILGGSVSRAFPFFEKSMRARLQEYAYPTALRRLVITCSEKENIHLLGAAALFFDAQKRK
jgi:glucokinase